MSTGSLFANYRKILSVNFFLFLLSLILYAELFNHFYKNNDDLLNSLKDFNFIIYYILTYLFIMIIFVPMMKFLVQILPAFLYNKYTYFIIDFFNNDESKNVKNDFMSLSELKKISLKRENQVLYLYYLEKKEEYKSMEFTMQYSFANIFLIIMNYFFVDNGIIQFLKTQDNFLLNSIIIIPSFLMFLIAIKYFEFDEHTIYKKDIPNFTDIKKVNE